MSDGLNLHVYASSMVGESRIMRMSASLQGSGLFRETHIVGVRHAGCPDTEELAGGRRIRRLGAAPGLRSNALGKAVHMLHWFLTTFLTYRREHVAVVNAHSVWVLPTCWALARSTGSLLVYNTHELETRTPTMRGVKWLLADVIERTLIRTCDVVCVVNGSIAAWYADHRGGPEPIVVRNIPLEAHGATSLREDLGLSSSDFLYIHTGALVSGRNIPAILAAFGRRPEAHVAFLGSGVLESEIADASRVHPNIHLREPVPVDRVVDHVREADVALVLIEPSCLSYQLSSPNKLFEALAAGVPPLSTDLAEVRRHVGSSADNWIIADITELDGAIARITRADVEAFRRDWHGLPSWDAEVECLLRAVGELQPA